MNETRFIELKDITKTDPTFKQITEYVINGRPLTKSDVKMPTKLYWEQRHDINITESKSEKSFYWPGMTKDIEDIVFKCPECRKYAYKQVKEPRIKRDIPMLPWQYIAVTFCILKGKITWSLLTITPNIYIEVEPLRSKTASRVSKTLQKIFATHGIPEKLFADNIPFGSYEFRNFAAQLGFSITTSSPRYAHSNDRAEKSVGIVKSWLKKACDLSLALMEYRNSPISSVPYSPVQMLINVPW
jgi:hypothetical protein